MSSVRSTGASEEPVNKAELVAALEGRLGSRKVAAEALEAVVDTITRTVARGEKVVITGFGSFERAVRGPRVGRNLRTGESVKIKKRTVPRFRPGTAFKSYVADPGTLPKARGTTDRAVAATTRVAAGRSGETAARTVSRATTRATKATVPPPTPARRATATKAPTKRAAKKA
jgi:DNA-binding protein HU-beta